MAEEAENELIGHGIIWPAGTITGVTVGAERETHEYRTRQRNVQTVLFYITIKLRD